MQVLRAQTQKKKEKKGISCAQVLHARPSATSYAPHALYAEVRMRSAYRLPLHAQRAFAHSAGTGTLGISFITGIARANTHVKKKEEKIKVGISYASIACVDTHTHTHTQIYPEIDTYTMLQARDELAAAARKSGKGSQRDEAKECLKDETARGSLRPHALVA